MLPEHGREIAAGGPGPAPVSRVSPSSTCIASKARLPHKHSPVEGWRKGSLWALRIRPFLERTGKQISTKPGVLDAIISWGLRGAKLKWNGLPCMDHRVLDESVS